MKIGLFGGSFNPIHNGHISLARQLLMLAGLDEVWLMVSPQNPLKQGSTELLDDQLRFEIARKALMEINSNVENCANLKPRIVASDYELHLPKPSYTWNTLQQLKKDHPDDTFILLIGGDNWQNFHQWYRADDILSEYRIVVYPRRGSNIDRTTLPENVTVVDTMLLDISSTLIRQRVRAGEEIRGLVPDCIIEEVKQYYSCRQQQ